MKNLIKLIALFVFLTVFNMPVFSIETAKIDKMIKNSQLYETATVSVSIKNVNGSSVYELNSKKLLHPASTLKLFTMYPSIEVLGYEYLFKTQFYEDNQNNLYIKLGADPLLTTSELKKALSTVKSQGKNSYKNLYIDDSIIDKKEFSEGWMWDDDVNPYTPKVSAYNLDNNLLRFSMTKNTEGLAEIRPLTTYPISIFNYITTGQKTDYLNVNRYNWNNPELIEVYGSVTTPKPFTIPISSMRRYFIYNIESALEEANIKISSTLFASKIVPENSQLITEITHPITNVLPKILQDSNNLMAETVYKLAASQKYTSTGSDILASEMFKEFYESIGIKTDNILVKDGCGISRNNLISADWMTDSLNAIYKLKGFETFKEYMAQPGDGTLSHRLFDLRGDAWLKTGSLSNISAITGYIHSQDGNTYSVSILIQNFNDKPLNIKSFENEIINLIYNR